MPRGGNLSRSERMQMRLALQNDVESGGLPLREAVRRMRLAVGLTQARFAEIFKLTPRQVWEIENGRGNPSVKTIEKIARPFGFEVGVVASAPSGERRT